jgi:Flp pilus assembly protein TadG
MTEPPRHPAGHNQHRRPRPRPRWAVRAPRGDDGLAVLELVIATTLLISILLLVVGFGRYTQAQQLVTQAAGAAARAASLDTTPAQASTDAQQTARDSIANGGQSCTDVQISVDTTAFHPGGQVSVTVSCTADLSQLTLAGFEPSETVHSTQTAPLEIYRTFGSRAPATSSGAGRPAAGEAAA